MANIANIANTAQKIAHGIAQTTSSASHTQARKSASSDADLFLKRSAAYYHAQTASSLDSVSNLRTQRDPSFEKILKSLAPENINYSPSLMHTRLNAAHLALKNATLQNSLQKASNKELAQTAQILQQRIEQSLTLQQDANDNQRLLIRA